MIPRRNLWSKFWRGMPLLCSKAAINRLRLFIGCPLRRLTAFVISGHLLSIMVPDNKMVAVRYTAAQALKIEPFSRFRC
ncbi:hypothetical protein BJY04DRAFT_189136 [Aspergillus karnatakaensis]|uniref:uncharacterized protein n=1 Tax=Aspergillus karnatakaensis TaxID=1810916 RepID=UPI003CCDB898